MLKHTYDSFCENLFSFFTFLKWTFYTLWVLIVASGIMLGLSGCTENQRARHFGGTTTFEGLPGKTVVNVSWKEGNDLWVVYRDRKPNEKPETVVFKEYSSIGVMNGTINIVEK